MSIQSIKCEKKFLVVVREKIQVTTKEGHRLRADRSTTEVETRCHFNVK